MSFGASALLKPLLSTFNVTIRRMSSAPVYKVSLVQMLVGKDKSKNLSKARELVEKARKDGAQIVGLPECFNSPYGTQFFNEFAENVPDGESCKLLSDIAKENGIYLIGGTIPEVA